MINVHSFNPAITIKNDPFARFCSINEDDWTEEEGGGHGGRSYRREAAPDGAGGGGSVSATRGHGTKSIYFPV